MKRDLDLVRELMIKLEATPPGIVAENFPVPGHDSETVCEHLRLILEAQLAEGDMNDCLHGPAQPTFYRLTWKGHDFLALSRKSAWDKAKERMAERSADLPFDLVIELLKLAARATAGLPPA